MKENIKLVLDKIRWVYVLGAVSLYAGYSFYFQDTSAIDAAEDKLRGTKAQVGIMQKKIEEAMEFEKKMEEKKAQLADLESQLRSKKAELPKSFNVPDLLTDIFKEAEQVGLEVVHVVPDANEAKSELYASLKIEIESKGTFLQTFIFLDRLSKLKRLVGVTSVNLQSLSGSETRITLKGSTVALSGKKLTGGDKQYKAVSGKITLLAYRIM